MAGESIDQANLARIAALGQGKNNGEDPAGGENPLMEILTGGFNRILVAFGRAGLPGAVPVNTSVTTGVDAGLKSDGLQGKPIMPSGSFSGGDGFLRKLAALLVKGGFQIKDLTEGVGGGPMIAGLEIGGGESVSMASLGNFTPDYTPSSGVGRDSGLQMMS